MDKCQQEMRPEYDDETLRQMLQNGVRGKFTAKYREGTNLLKLAKVIRLKALCDRTPPGVVKELT